MKRTYRALQLGLALVIMVACSTNSNENTTNLKPPIAEKKDSVLTIHGDSRVDPYFWMRLTDEQKRAEAPDEQTQNVLTYLNQENDYKSEVMKHTEGFQTELFDEIVGRIKKTDESVPYFRNGYWYYTRYEEGKEYPIYARKEGSLDAEEQVMLNVNGMAEGFGYYAASGLNVSPDNTMAVFGEDTLSRRIYSLRFKDLNTGRFLDDEIPNAESRGAWSNDGQFYFYTSKNTVTLLSEKIWRHKLGDRCF